jgi:hypothetical protein
MATGCEAVEFKTHFSFAPSIQEAVCRKNADATFRKHRDAKNGG